MKLMEKKILPALVMLGAAYTAAPGMRGAVTMITAAMMVLTLRKASMAGKPVRVRATIPYRDKLAANLRKRF